MARKSQRVRSDVAKKQLMELPIDTLVDIFLRLPAKSLGCIRCVSKTLLKMVNNISFSRLHTHLLIAANSAAAADSIPLLMLCSQSWLQESDDLSVTLQSLKYNTNTLTKGRYAITFSPHYYAFSSHYYVCFVFCNLFCLRSNNGDCILINPLREREVVRLPETTFVQPTKSAVIRNCRFGMGFDNKTNTYKLLGVTHHESDNYFQFGLDEGEAALDENQQRKFNGDYRHKYCMTAHILVLGTDSWREIPSLPPCDQLDIMNDPVCANGDVHWLTRERCKRIISFNFKKEEFYCIPTPPTLKSSYNSKMRLLTLRGSLAIVETSSSSSPGGIIMNIEIWVLKDFDEKQWVRYYKNKISDTIRCGLSSPGEWEHGIFFTSHNFPHTCVFFLDLRDGSVNRVLYPLCQNENFMGMHSYPETLISLKDYGNLEDAHEVIA